MLKSHLIRVFGMYFLVAMLLLVSVPGLRAQDSDSTQNTGVVISLRPKDTTDGTRFEADVEPGESAELVAILENFGVEPIALVTYSSGLIPVPNGGLRVANSESERSGSALWLDYQYEELTLQPGESVERPFTISVPEGTPPGQYVNGISLVTANPVNESDSFRQFFSKVVSVYVTVPGDIHAEFQLGEPQFAMSGAGTVGLLIPFENTGNTRVDLSGGVRITDNDGVEIFNDSISLSPFYMSQVSQIQVPLPTTPTPGDYTLSFEFTDFTSGYSVSIEELEIEIPEFVPQESEPIEFENVEISANADPIVFANVSVDVTSRERSYSSAKLTMSVSHNGELVEDFVLAENLRLEQGTTTITQRYLPVGNWESGSYTFTLKLEFVESDTTGLLLEEVDVATLEVP